MFKKLFKNEGRREQMSSCDYVSVFNVCIKFIYWSIYLIIFVFTRLAYFTFCGVMNWRREGLWEQAAGLGTDRGH